MLNENIDVPRPDDDQPNGGVAADLPLLPLPPARCLTSEQAAAYLAIGMTLLVDLDIPYVKLGRRRVYDKVDLDTWLDEHKRRGRARKETEWPVKPESTGEATRLSGGSMLHYPTADAYAKALGLATARKRKPSSSS
jgi:hypothetical protein